MGGGAEEQGFCNRVANQHSIQIFGGEVALESESVANAEPKVDSLSRQLYKNWLAVKKAKAVWDFRSLQKAQAAYADELQELARLWPEFQVQLEQETLADSEFVRSEAYGAAVEEALKAAGIPLQGSFPTYEFPPFKLTISVETQEAKLGMGRKLERSTALHPKTLSAWVSARYQAVAGKRFDAALFMRDLLNAYKAANKIAYREADVLWGRAVGLDAIYELLTLKQSARQEYPKALFVYNLARLKEQFDLTQDEYRLELGTARNQNKALLIVDSQGRESHISSLTIYKVAKEA